MRKFSLQSRVVALSIAVLGVGLIVAPLSASATFSHDTLSLNVTPNTGLNRAGQNVTASGAITPQYGHTGMSVKIEECKSSTCTTVVASTPLSNAGLYSATVPVTLCEPGCVLKAKIIQDPGDNASKAISFAPPSPTTTSLELSATGFPSGSTISIPFGTTVHAQATVTTPGAFPLTGVLSYKLFTDAACTTASGSGISTTLPANAGADAPSVSILVPTPGTYFWKASYAGDANNLASSTTCNAYNVTYTQPLVTSITATPDPVTAGQLVQYTLTVNNTSPSPIAGVNVIDTLPAGTTLFSAPGCSGSGPVTCPLGTIVGGGNASVQLLVTTGSPGVITNTANATPGSNNAATLDVLVKVPVPGQISGFVVPGGTLNTGGNDPAKFSLPANAGTGTGNGAPVTMTQEPGNFCNGPCNGTTTTISPVNGYTDPKKPVVAVLAYNYTGLVAATKDFLHADIYKFDDATEITGSVVKDCKDNPAWSNTQKAAAALRRIARVGTQSGIANPVPCLDARSITVVSKFKYTVTFTVLYLSGDPHLGRK